MAQPLYNRTCLFKLTYRCHMHPKYASLPHLLTPLTQSGHCLTLPLYYFSRKNSSLLRLTKTKFDGRVLLRTCTNGSSELMSNVSMSLVNMLYNIQLLDLAGENGVSAYGTMMYVNMIFLAIFIGYSIGTAPVVGFHLGAENYPELRNLLKKSAVAIGLGSVAMLGLGFVLARPLSVLFVGYDPVLCELTVHGFYIFAVSFLFVGFAIFFSGFFTALNDGLVSAGISFLRTLVCQTAAVINEEVCPYFKRDRGGGRVVCEGASFKFPDKLSRREYLYRFCAHPEGYKSCPLKVALDHYYERKYDYQA